jgi:hypothetical protein
MTNGITMTRMKRVLLYITGFTLAVLAIILLLTFAFTEKMCGLKTKAQILSPDARYLARMDQDDCGALSGFDYYGMLIDNRPRLGLDILGHAGTALFTVNRANSTPKLYWENSTTLIVECSDCYNKDSGIWANRWRDIHVEYVLPGDRAETH